MLGLVGWVAAASTNSSQCACLDLQLAMLIAGRKNIRQFILHWFARSLSQHLALPKSRKYSDSCYPTSTPPLPSNRVILSGIQPTGVPHLGNYLGALQQWVKLQNDAPLTTKLFFSIVDLHAITVRQNPERLRNWKFETLATLLAIGLDPSRSIIFFQSDVCDSAHQTRVHRCTEDTAGPSTCGVDVDIKLQCIDGISIADDSMESILPRPHPALTQELTALERNSIAGGIANKNGIKSHP